MSLYDFTWGASTITLGGASVTDNTGNVTAGTINEYTAATGVRIDAANILAKDGDLYAWTFVTPTIDESGSSGVTVDGVVLDTNDITTSEVECDQQTPAFARTTGNGTSTLDATHIGCATGGATPTIDLDNADDVTGRLFRVSDIDGNASSNNITVTDGGSFSDTISTNWASELYLYTGSAWVKI